MIQFMAMTFFRMMFLAALLAVVVPYGKIRADNIPRLKNAAEISAALHAGVIGARFDISATVTYPCNPLCCTIAVEDDSGAITLREDTFFPKCPFKAGDKVHLTGVTFQYPNSGAVVAANNSAEIIGSGPAPLPKPASIRQIMSGEFDYRLIRIQGMVHDAFIDEIDPTWCYIVIMENGESIYACFSVKNLDINKLLSLVGAQISLCGVSSTYITGSRKHFGRQILTTGLDAVSIIRAAPPNPFDAPGLLDIRDAYAAQIHSLNRRRISGRVIAVWKNDRILLRTKNNIVSRVDLADKNPPEYGDSIEAVGKPETDLFRLNLSRAIWRTSSIPSLPECAPEDVTAAQLLSDGKGRSAVQTSFHGKPVRIRGIVRSMPSPNNPNDRMGLECDRRMIPIDASATPKAFKDVSIGCTIDVSGTFLVETENWRPNAPFPHIDGFAIVVRTPDDVQIVSRPPWWTVGRLSVFIAALLTALTGVMAWNISLNRIAERRGRELTEETVARVTADLKVGERTRLAIELHDSLSQNLTGAALEVQTAATLTPESAQPALQHLDIAAKTLKSCRKELRNCLWDLRNDALDEKTMDAAIRSTIIPHVGGTDISVRFNVPRESISDNSAHSILRIIRELVQNAVRHGNAKSIDIAGCIENGHLLFSVQDDGCGFDTSSISGVQQGHFGLQGIRERIKQLGGKVLIESKIGEGAKITISAPCTLKT